MSKHLRIKPTKGWAIEVEGQILLGPFDFIAQPGATRRAPVFFTDRAWARRDLKEQKAQGILKRRFARVVKIRLTAKVVERKR